MDGIVLGRVGHYFNSGNGSCSVALVTDVTNPGQLEGLIDVNVVGWTHGNSSFGHEDVPVVAAPTKDDTTSSFHFTRDCPWSR